MNHKARATIEEFSMLRRGDTVTAAVSGGADSVALLDFLCSLLDYELDVRACHLNHCLRGAESDRDEQLVRTMCAQYGVALTVKRVEVRALAGAQGLSLELAAREARYAFFREVSEAGGGKIATAHTQSDTAETVLLNLARGTGLAGLCGIPPIRGAFIRPLIACTRAEIENYAKRHGLCYVTDSTNLSDDYTRNHIRHNVWPQLLRVNPSALDAVGRMTSTLRQDADYLQEQARRAAQDCAAASGFDAAKLRALHPAILARVVAGILESGGIERSAERIALVRGLLEDTRERGTIQVGKRCYAILEGGILRLERRQKRIEEPLEPLQLAKMRLDGIEIDLGYGKKLYFSALNSADYEISDNNGENLLKYAVDYDKLNNDVFLRSRQPGDAIRPIGRGCTKTLKKLFSELALPKRERLCVLADCSGVFFAEGVGADERVCVDTKTKRILTIALTRERVQEFTAAPGNAAEKTEDEGNDKRSFEGPDSGRGDQG